MRRLYRRRRIAVVLSAVALVAVVLLTLRGEGRQAADAQGTGSEEDAAAPPPELPGGGRELFPEHRVVSFYGAPQADELGELGIGTPASAVRRLREQAKPYETEERPVLLALELIATIADASPGEDGLYQTRQEPAVVRKYLTAAREAGALLVLDIQPGRSDFMSEAKALRRFLDEPDVGLALDPEWRMGPDEVPGQTIGSVEAAEVNRVAKYLGRLVERHNLPEKLLLIHQFTGDMIVNREELKAPPGVDLTLNVDGVGGPSLKRKKYRELVRLDSRERPGDASPAGAGAGDGGAGNRPGGGASLRFPVGFKLFYEEDTDLLSPEQVLGLSPPPDLVIYE